MGFAAFDVRVGTITVSDTRTEANDASGAALRDALREFALVAHRIVPDEPARIRAIVEGASDATTVDALVFTGGTGIGPRDVTYEAVTSLFDKELPGFGEAFRRLSWDEVGPRSILSRATAGVVGSLVVFVLPGSENAARLGATSLVAKVLVHAVSLVKGQTAHAAPLDLAPSKGGRA